METIVAPVTSAQPDFRAELHQIIDQIQDEAVLWAVLLLLVRQVAAENPEPVLSPAWQHELQLSILELGEGKGIPAAKVFARLQQNTAA